MVNFGKKLESGSLRVARWKNKYVNYKQLKKIINNIVKCEVTGDLVNAETNVGHFIKVLDEDLTVIEATYLSTLTELNQNIDKVNAEVDALVNSASFSGEIEGEVAANSETETRIQMFATFSKTLDEINKFCLVNFEGVRKIIKKFKKQVTVRDISEDYNQKLLQFQFIRYTELDNSNTTLKKRERVLYDRISHRSPILEQFIKTRKGLGDMLDKYENDILDKKSDHDLQCCEYLIKFTCCKIDKNEDEEVNKSGTNGTGEEGKKEFHGDLCKYYTDKCCKNTCLGNMIESHLKRWLVIATAISLIVFGTLIIFYEIVRPSRLNTLTIVGYVLAAMLGTANGANDICNSVGTSVGAKALTLKQAIIFGAFFEFMGALFMGTEVAKTISKGVIEPSSYTTNPLLGDCDGPQIFAVGMCSVLTGAGLTTLAATVYGLPISATHGIIGSLVAVGLISRGPGSIGIQSLISTLLAWVLSPLVGAIAAGLFYFIIQFSIYSNGSSSSKNRTDQEEVNIDFAPVRSKRLQPVFLAIGIAISCAFLLTKGPSMLKVKPLGIAILVALAIGAGAGIVLMVFRSMKENGRKGDKKNNDVGITLANISTTTSTENKDDSNDGEGEVKVADNGNQNVAENAVATDNLISVRDTVESKRLLLTAQYREEAEKYFVPLLILSALTVAFAHGGNDVGNAIGPLAVILEVRNNAQVDGTPSMPFSILLLGASSFVSITNNNDSLKGIDKCKAKH